MRTLWLLSEHWIQHPALHAKSEKNAPSTANPVLPCEQALGIVKEKAALGSEREKLLTQFESMTLEQQQAMLQVFDKAVGSPNA
eukprot:SAG31_NODE_511_length_14722_cov_14.770499_16_plen_84_part_00